jgi:hypothetical protein
VPRRVLVPVLLIAAAWAATWLAFGEREEGGGGPPEAPLERGPGTNAGPALVGTALLAPEWGPISGSVALPPGAPASAVRVVAAEAKGADAAATAGRVEDDATFRVGPLAPGVYLVEATLAWGSVEYRALEKASAGATDVVLSLEPRTPGEWRVRVLGADGEPLVLGTLRCEAHVVGGILEVEVSIERGQATFAIPRGTRRVWFHVKEAWDAGGKRLGPVAAAFGPVDGGGGEHVIRLRPLGRVRGSVVDPGGAPLEGVEVLLRARAGSGADGEEEDLGEPLAVFTDASGAFDSGPLTDGLYLLDVTPPPGFRGPAPREVAAGGPAVTLALADGVPLALTLRDAEGKPVPGASATLYGGSAKAAGRPVPVRQTAVADAEGVVRFTALDPAQHYALTATPPRERPDCRDAYLGRVDFATRDVAFGRLFAIRGRVLDPDGRLVRHAHVQQRLVSDAWVSRAWAEDGTFVVRGLQEGQQFELRASTDANPNRDERAGTPVAAKAGDLDCVLVVDPGPRILVRLSVKPAQVDMLELVRESLPMSSFDPARVAEDGTATFFRLDPSRLYHLWVRARDEQGGALCALVENLRPSDREVEVVLGPGGTVTGVVRFADDPDKVVHGYVNLVSDGFRAYAEIFSGTFRIDGLPARRWRVVVSPDDGSRSWTGEADVDTGHDVEVVLTPSVPSPPR